LLTNRKLLPTLILCYLLKTLWSKGQAIYAYRGLRIRGVNGREKGEQVQSAGMRKRPPSVNYDIFWQATHSTSSL
jgi:hypothetical protein